MTPPDKERGAALLTVLLLVAVMATVSATALDRISLATRLTGNVSLASQGRQWLGMAEQLSIVRLEDMIAASPKQTTGHGWMDQPRSIDLPDGGRVTARISDGGNCFNLNGLVAQTSEGRLMENPAAAVQFSALMTSLGVDPTAATRIAAAATDWIDADQVTRPSGAEDEAYAARGGRAPNRAMADPSELGLVAGVTPEIATMLRPWVCALPAHEFATLNINTLRPDQAPLLAMLAPAQISVERARAALSQRPAGGFASEDAFWKSPALNGVTPVSGQLKLRTSWFRLQARVEAGGQAMGEVALLGEREGKVRLVRREWSTGE